jgi:hypothetical protein
MAGNAFRPVISISASADSARSVRSRRGQRASSRNLSLKPWTFSPIKGRSLSRRDGEPASRAGLCWRCRRHSRPRHGTDHDSKPLLGHPLDSFRQPRFSKHALCRVDVIPYRTNAGGKLWISKESGLSVTTKSCDPKTICTANSSRPQRSAGT